MVESSADFGSYTLAIVVPKVSLFRELIQIGLITAALTLLCLLALGIALRSSREQIINPLKKLSLNMREFSKGNLQVRTEEKSGVAEIHELETIFNTMTKEIKALKIDTYEKQLLVRDVRYKYLQVQIRPHFYINMLNLIYGLAQVNQNETIQTLAIATSDYLRYILGSEDRLIPLSRELEGVRNYMKIQQIRYRDRIRYEIAQEADDRCPVPPLLIQTFLENAVKHNITVHPVLCITVRLRASGTPEHPYLSISVTDNGAGFPEDLAERLNHRKEPPHGGEKIGIMNIVNRMELLFDTDFSFEIHNLPPETEEAAASGASVQIRIPARTDDEGLMPPV